MCRWVLYVGARGAENGSATSFWVGCKLRLRELKVGNKCTEKDDAPNCEKNQSALIAGEGKNPKPHKDDAGSECVQTENSCLLIRVQA